MKRCHDSNGAPASGNCKQGVKLWHYSKHKNSDISDSIRREEMIETVKDYFKTELVSLQVLQSVYDAQTEKYCLYGCYSL